MSNNNTEPPARSWGCFLPALLIAGVVAVILLSNPAGMAETLRAANPIVALLGLIGFLLLLAIPISKADTTARDMGAPLLNRSEEDHAEIAGFYKLMIFGGLAVLLIVLIALAISGKK